MNKIDATKEQMVKFLLAFYKAANKRTSPAKLRKVSKDRLWLAISSSEELLHMFHKYLEAENAREKTDHCAVTQVGAPAENTISAAELSQKLESLTANLVACPVDVITAWEFKKFVAQLPHGVIPRETQDRAYDLLQTIDPPNIGASYMLCMLEFMIADSKARTDRYEPVSNT